MPYLSFLERHALERGIEQGIEKGIEKGSVQGRLKTLELYLKKKYGEEAVAWLSGIGHTLDDASLAKLCEDVFAADTADTVRALLTESDNGRSSQG